MKGVAEPAKTAETAMSHQENNGDGQTGKATAKPAKLKRPGRPKRENRAQVANNGKIDNVKLLEMKLTGYTYRDLGEMFGIDQSAVHRRISRLIKSLEKNEIKDYKSRRVQILTGVEREILKYMLDPEKLEKAAINNLAYAFSQIHSARRLEEGKATKNVEVHVVDLERYRTDRVGGEEVIECQVEQDQAGEQVG